MADTSANLTYEGHEENTAPTSMDGHPFESPATYVPLSKNPTSVNSKTSNGEKGE